MRVGVQVPIGTVRATDRIIVEGVNRPQVVASIEALDYFGGLPTIRLASGFVLVVTDGYVTVAVEQY